MMILILHYVHLISAMCGNGEQEKLFSDNFRNILIWKVFFRSAMWAGEEEKGKHG